MINPHTVRAETDQEAQDYNRLRVAFLRHVIADDRTGGRLFAFWAEQTGVDQTIGSLTPILDRIAFRAGCDTRAIFRTDGAALFNAIEDRDERVQLLEIFELIDGFLDGTRDRRRTQAVGFVVSQLYGAASDDDVPVRAWLAADLVDVFDELARCRLWATPCRLTATVPARMAPDNPRGKRGKRSGPHLEDYAHWYYRHCVAEPRATLDDLARERLTALGEDRAPRDYAGVGDRPDHATIRYGIEKARRLLEMTVPPEHWTAYFAEFFPDRGGKIPS